MSYENKINLATKIRIKLIVDKLNLKLLKYFRNDIIVALTFKGDDNDRSSKWSMCTHKSNLSHIMGNSFRLDSGLITNLTNII